MLNKDKRELSSSGTGHPRQGGSSHPTSQSRGRGNFGNPEQHAAAGRKGGEVVSKDRDHMAEIGHKGGEEVSRDRGHMSEIGRKGGQAVSQDRKHMSQIGRKGGEARGND